MDQFAIEKTKNKLIQLVRNLEAFELQEADSCASHDQSDAEQDAHHAEVVADLQRKILELQQQNSVEEEKAKIDHDRLKVVSR